MSCVAGVGEAAMFAFLGGLAKKRLGYGYSVKADPILLYYLSILDVRAHWLHSKGIADKGKAEILEEAVKRRLQLEQAKPGEYTEDAAWTEAYRIERLMALVEPVDSLIPEIRLRLDEAVMEKVSAVPRLRTALTLAEARALDMTKTPPELRASEEPLLRALLLEILEETHWTNQRKFYSRPIQKVATRRIIWAGLLSFVLFILPYLWIYIQAYSHPKITAEVIIGLPLYTALTAGLFGAYFSRLLYIQTNANILSIGELKSARELTSIFLRGSVGMCGALVVFFFLRSGIVNGSLFPVFSEMGVREGAVPLFDTGAGQPAMSVRQILPSPSLALLAIWCFLAGFSERLVPTILSSTEQTLGEAAKGTKK